MTEEAKRQMIIAYDRHVAREYYDPEEGPVLHPDGCFYCGGGHFTSACHDTGAIRETWDLEELR
jgi:hypothetical protein